MGILVEQLTDLAAEVAAAGAAVHAAGEPGSVAADAKASPTDLVTAVDRAAEQRMVDTIVALRPDDGILGEEGTARDSLTGVRWVIDALDGTANYVTGYPAHAVSVGVELHGVATIGVVRDTARNVEYVGSIERAATADGHPIRVRTAVPVDRAICATGFSPRHEQRRAQAAELATILPRIGDIRRTGSPALDLCAVAAGGVHAYFEIGIAPWDYTAGMVVVQAAGGVVHVGETAPGRGRLVVAGPSALVKELRATLAYAGVPGA